MATIGFIGLGNMGLPMARNLVKSGHAVSGFDLSEYASERLAGDGGTRASSVVDACKDAEIVITMLPAGEQVREAYLGVHSFPTRRSSDLLLIDSSTIDVDTARQVAQAAEAKGLAMIDAPVSGGVSGAQAASLTFMVGGPDAAFERARPVLEQMGKTIVHAGGAGNGQAAKICNNMILGASMIVVSEAFLLAEKLGLDAQRLFDISSKSSGQCWSMTGCCRFPDRCRARPQIATPQAGFTAADAQGLEPRAGRRTRHARHHAARRGRRCGRRAVRRQRRRQRRFFRHHSLSARGVRAATASRRAFYCPP
jgi:3-hydroxyisobutyrate dehydrogenase